MECPYCGTELGEVCGSIQKEFEGEFDSEGNLITETSSERVTEIRCRNCDEELSLDLIKNWR